MLRNLNYDSFHNVHYKPYLAKHTLTDLYPWQQERKNVLDTVISQQLRISHIHRNEKALQITP